MAAALALLIGAAPTGTQAVERASEEGGGRRPPPSASQGLNGVLRASRQEEARPARIDSVRQVFAAIRACWRLAPRPGITGQQITLRMSFKGTGELLGAPRITYYEGLPGSEASREFTDAVQAAFRACIPLPFTESFGAAVAGRPFTFRFVDDRPV